VALRYLLARRKQAFISLISFISVLGVCVGVIALLIALALMTGLQGELRDRIVGSAAHVYVFRVGGIENPAEDVKRLMTVPRVVGAAPVVQGKALVKSSRGADAFISLKGIDPALEKTVTNIAGAMRSGSLEALNSNGDAPDGILIGQDLARTLDVAVGDRVQILSPEGTLTPFGPMMRQRTLAVVGVFSLGLYEFDSAYGFVNLAVGERLLGKDHPDFIQLRIDDMFRSKDVVAAIADRFGADFLADEWTELNRSLFSALWLEKMAISISIGLIVMVAALNIIASLILLVMEKSRDIAILKTMGASSRSIRRIFMLQGLVIGLIGTSAGAIAGSMLIFVLDRYKLISIPLDVYQISHIPFTLRALDFAIVVLSAVLICFLATIYPSRQAAKLDPAEALRYQ
jgi:lipoprotein-releasing system permease protein